MYTDGFLDGWNCGEMSVVTFVQKAIKDLLADDFDLSVVDLVDSNTYGPLHKLERVIRERYLAAEKEKVAA
jgi:hypothetical protein